MAFRDPFLITRFPFGSFFDDDHDLDLFNALRREMLDSAAERRGAITSGSSEKQGQKSGGKGTVATQQQPGSGSALGPWRSFNNELAPLMSTDLVESENDYHIHVDLPGIAPEDVEVSIVDNNKAVLIQAERKAVHEEKTDKVHSMERRFGKVQRKIRLPGNADVDAAQTKFKQGVLSISFPKKAQTQSVRKLAIVSEDSK